MQFVREKLNASQYVVLATQGQDGPWACPLYFAYDEQLNLYVLSQPSTSLHMKHVAANSAVACAVYDSSQQNMRAVAGVQIKGSAHIVGPDEVQTAFDTYFAPTPTRTPPAAAFPPQEYAQDDAMWRFVKIVPEEVWVFSEEDFEGSRVMMPKEALESVRR